MSTVVFCPKWHSGDSRGLFFLGVITSARGICHERDEWIEWWPAGLAEGQRCGVTVDDSDLIIAATALTEGLPLVTANPKHFEWIGALHISNWREA